MIITFNNDKETIVVLSDYGRYVGVPASGWVYGFIY